MGRKPTGRPSGRPRISDDETRVLSVRLPVDVVEQLEALGQPSVIARAIILKALST